MKRIIVVTTLSALTVLLVQSSAALAGKDLTCYDVEGTVETENESATVQVGTIRLVLTNQSTGVAEFDEEGSLIGNITGADITKTFLSHTAQFSPGNKFTTSGDEAVVLGVKDVVVDENGISIPCSFWIHETLTDFRKASKFFAKAKKVEQHIAADGYVSNCPSENRNSFDLSGEFCKK